MAYNTNAYVKVGASYQRVNLSSHWDMVDGKPTNFTPTTHNHDDRYYTESEVTTLLAAKAPTNHASTSTGYGLGSTTSYGHVKTVDTLTQSAHVNGTALSAYQGKVLKDMIDNINPPVSGFTKCFTISATDVSASEYTEYANVNGYKDIIIVYNTSASGYPASDSQWIYANTTVIMGGTFPGFANSGFDISQEWWYFYWDYTGQTGKYLSVWGR